MLGGLQAAAGQFSLDQRPVHGCPPVVRTLGTATCSVGYLGIINLSGRVLELPSDDQDETWPPYVEIAGVRINMIAVRAPPPASASIAL